MYHVIGTLFQQFYALRGIVFIRGILYLLNSLQAMILSHVPQTKMHSLITASRDFKNVNLSDYKSVVI